MSEIKHPTIKEFKKWLLVRKTYKEIGSSRNSNNCPLARFMKYIYGEDNPDVSISVYPKEILYHYRYSPARTIPLRSWAVNFISNIDAIGNETRRKYLRPISGQEALDVLNRVTK